MRRIFAPWSPPLPCRTFRCRLRTQRAPSSWPDLAVRKPANRCSKRPGH
jgi:hypothetical protein